MNEKNGTSGNGRQGNQPQPHYESKSQPLYELFKQGITEANRGWLEVLRRAGGKYFIPFVGIGTLYKIAHEVLRSENNRFNDKSFFGILLISGMILSIVIVSLCKNTDVWQKENRKESEIESAESGAGGISPGQNRRITTRNRGSNPDGGSE